jgi:hypothetical protein
MDKIKTVGDMRALISDLDDDFKIELRIRQKLSDEELKNMSYPYPYKTQYTNLVFDDIGYSDKDLCLGCELKSNDALHESKDDNNVGGEK